MFTEQDRKFIRMIFWCRTGMIWMYILILLVCTKHISNYVNNDAVVAATVYVYVKIKFISGLIQLVTLSFNYAIVKKSCIYFYSMDTSINPG